MKKLRKVDTKKRNAKHRDAAAALEKSASFLLSLPEECCVCQEKFERTNETVKSWHVTAFEERRIIRLTCPPCWDKIETLVKGKEDV